MKSLHDIRPKSTPIDILVAYLNIRFANEGPWTNSGGRALRGDHRYNEPLSLISADYHMLPAMRMYENGELQAWM